MKFILVLAVLVAAASAASIKDETAKAWSQYKLDHGKSYSSVSEEIARKMTWQFNQKYITKHNVEADNGKHTYWVKMNKYGDLSSEEFVAQMNSYNKSKTMQKPTGNPTFMAPSNVEIPDSVDWRTQGYVTPVKDQGQCGSCWAFSAVASLEGQHFKQAGKLVSLSEQQLVDCSRSFGNEGCNGGLMTQAFAYIQSNKGIDTEDSYPYHARDGKCVFKPANIGATDAGSTDIPAQDEAALTAAIATVGPISVAIDASQSSFQFYSHGIYTDAHCSSTQLDHGVTAVGYGSNGAGQDFYIVKNSWGTSWGDKGYIEIARNKKNMCGIATMACYPMV